MTPKIDPKKKIPSFLQTLKKMQIILSVFMLGLMGIIYAGMIGLQLPLLRYLSVSMALLFLLLGNYFGKLRPNYFIGIRLPWTLENEDNWLKTHRLAGKIWVLASLIMLALSILVPLSWIMILFIPYFLVLFLVPIVYSYRLYKTSEGQPG